MRALALALGLTGSLFMAVSPVLAAEGTAAHKVVSVDGAGDGRRIAVRLDARLTEAGLKSLAAALRDKAPDGKRPGIITFYLPSQPLSQAPWAEARFNPEQSVTINGLRFEEVTAFASEAAGDSRDVIGVWLTAPPALPGMLTIWRDKTGKRFADWHLRSGRKTNDELEEVKTGRGRRFEIKGSNGGYYLATWAGPLELGEGNTVLASAERLVVTRVKPAEAAAKNVQPAASTPVISAKAPSPVTAAATSATRAAEIETAKTATAGKPASKPQVRRKHAEAKPAVSRTQSVADAIRATLAR